jgi:glycosyltransferase involved in cell wall biosynthesis
MKAAAMNERLILVREERFLRTPDGRIWSRWGTDVGTWGPYLLEFGELVVLARIQQVPDTQPGWTRADHEGVTFLPVPYFHGPLEYLKVRQDLIRMLKQYVMCSDPVVLRVPSPLANAVADSVLTRPYAVEVAGDPYDQMSPGAMRHPLRPVFRKLYVHNQRKLCAHATSINYVTERSLQVRYPPSRTADSFSSSDVDLPSDAYRSVPKHFSGNQLRLICVGMMEQLYKGQDVLIEALSELRAQDVNVDLTLVGDGAFRPYLVSHARRKRVSEYVHFTGIRDRAEIRHELDRTDVFVLASRQEGMPRAMLEAMARSLPCVGTAAGGAGSRNCSARPFL